MGYVVLQCKYKADFIPITLDKRDLFLDLVRVVCDRFGLNKNSITLSYVVRDGQKILLGSEAELRDMRVLVTVLGIKLVDVIVSDSSLALVARSEVSVCSISVVFDEVEDCEVESRNTGKVFLSTGWVNIINGVCLVFTSGVLEFREALQKYIVECGWEFLLIKNGKENVYARCPGMVEHECGWYIKATLNVVDNNFIKCKLVSGHCCPLQEIYDANKFLTCKLIYGLILEKLRDDPSIGASGVVSFLKLDYSYHISYYKAWMAFQAANGSNMGNSAESFKQLEGYIKVLCRTNPGSQIMLEVEDVEPQSKRFSRLFFSFVACIQGFKHVFPVLFIDGTFLKGKHTENLLSVVGNNGNRGSVYIIDTCKMEENKLHGKFPLKLKGKATKKVINKQRTYKESDINKHNL